MMREPNVMVAQGFVQYGRLYRHLASYRQNVVTADVQVVTTNYAEVSQGLNTRFGRAFMPYVNSGEIPKRRVEAANRWWQSVQSVRPLPARREAIDAASREVALHPLLSAMTDLHSRLLA
jgi:hypothetical protein